MTRRYRILLLPALALMGAAQPSIAGHPDQPDVVELFQSQGCSSCPPADAVLNRLADRRDLLALSFAVTYWDQLGWKDSFASPAFTQRQWDYARAAGRGSVATPQMVINGRGVVNGGDPAEVAAALRRYARPAGGPEITSDHGAVSIGAGRGHAILWLVRYDPRAIPVPIGAGENAGRTIVHRDIVRQLIRLGTWQGTAGRYPLPPAPPGLAAAVIAQSSRGGPIIAAHRL